MRFLVYFFGVLLIFVGIVSIIDGQTIEVKLIGFGMTVFFIYLLRKYYKRGKKRLVVSNKKNSTSKTNNERRCVVNFVNNNEWGQIELYFECWNEHLTLLANTSKKVTLIVGSNVQINDVEYQRRRTHKVMGSSMYHEDYLIL